MSGKSKFNRPKRRIAVDFDGHEDETLHGLVVTYQSMSVEKMLELMDLADEGKDDTTAAARKAFEALVGRLAKGIVSWNFCEEDEDEVAEISVGVLKRMEPDLLFALVDQWQQAVSGVSAPLARKSGSGQQSLAELPTTAL